MPDLTFTTRLSGEKNGEIYIRSEKLLDLIANHSFVETLYFSLTGRMPIEPQVQMLNALLVAGFDHGLSPASGFVPRVIAASGNEMTHCLAGGLLALGPYHGGAVDGAASLFRDLSKNQTPLSEIVADFKQSKKKFFGYGHRVYKEYDPRTRALFSLADQVKLDNNYRVLALQLENEIEKNFGKKLVLNIDGAFAAILLDLNLPINCGNGLFALSRVGGMIAHILEEYAESEPVRRIPSQAIHFQI